MKKKVLIAVLVIVCIIGAVFGWYLYRMWPMLRTTMGEVERTEEHQSRMVSEGSSGNMDAGSSGEDVSAVYMTTEITPEGLMNAYQALGVELTGDNIGVKLSTGEPGSNYLDPELIRNLVQDVDGTIVDFVIMDEDGSVSIPVEGGTRMTENLVGAHFPEYDGFLVLSHFKGHAIAGFGGAIKNISIGMASQEGKCLIHTDGASHTSPWGGAQDPFLECMAEAGKSVQDSVDGNILYINVLNRLSVDCDCDSSPAEPDMHDIGILASTDPVALDQASVDLVYAAEDGASLVQRMESRNAEHVLQHGEEIGLGNRSYDLISIDE